MKKRNIIIISAIAALLVFAAVFGLVAVIIMQRDFDYMKDDLSKYIEFSESDYKNYRGLRHDRKALRRERRACSVRR